MRRELAFGILIVFLLIIPTAASVEIGSASFTLSDPTFARNGFPVIMISTNYPRLANMEFQITGGTLSTIEIDLTNLKGSNEKRTLTVNGGSGNSCNGNAQNGYTCTVNDIRLKPSSASGTIPLDITTPNGASSTTIPFTFSIDNT